LADREYNKFCYQHFGGRASPVPVNWDHIKEFAKDVQELRQDSLKYGQ
jgi:hypothetical protein